MTSPTTRWTNQQSVRRLLAAETAQHDKKAFAKANTSTVLYSDKIYILQAALYVTAVIPTILYGKVGVVVGSERCTTLSSRDF